MYHDFTDKRALFLEVLRLTATDVADRIRADVVDIADPRESLERGCRSFFEAALDPACRQILLVDAPVVLGWNEWLGHDSALSGRLLDDAINRLYRRSPRRRRPCCGLDPAIGRDERGGVVGGDCRR